MSLSEQDLENDGRAPVPILVPGILLLVAIGGAVDLAFDRPASWTSPHVVFEVLLMTVSLTSSIVLWLGWRRTGHALVRAESEIARSRAERDAWRKSAESALSGFRAEVDRQFERWGLTPTEREVAMLLLQGHGHKQIAGRTGRSERTVRQHAVSVYEKSGLGGRAELAGFFLEGLVPDRRPDAPRTREQGSTGLNPPG